MARFSAANLVSLLALTSCAFAHLNLTETLATRRELSSFVGLFSQYPDLVRAVGSSNGTTVLAPSNSALTAFIGKLGPEGIKGVSNETIIALLSYHVLSGELSKDQLSAKGGATAETSLSGAESFANLGGKPNSVFASAYGSTGLEGDSAGPLRIYSGVGEPCQVGSSIGYEGGILHVINTVLNLPQNASSTAQTAGLTTLVSALSKAELVEAVDTTASVTIFAPTNQAFTDAGVNLDTISPTDLADVLKYHVIAGTVAYSSGLGDDQEVETLNGQSVRVRKQDDKILVNDAEVVQGNVILNNGVVHVINKVLMPSADGASASGSGSSDGAAGATGTTRRPTDPTGTSAGAGTSDEPADEGSARSLTASLFGVLGAVAAAFTLL